jgi:hypothetical protein
VLSEKEAASLLGLSTTLLRTWRCREKGPAFDNFGHTVRYSTERRLSASRLRLTMFLLPCGQQRR